MALLANKTILITGATSGIGKATAELMAQEGAHLILSGRNQAAGEALVDGILQQNGQADFVPADITCRQEVERLFEFIRSEHKKLDAAVNNAGMLGCKAPFHLQTDEQWDQVLSVNLGGTRRCLQHELSLMLPEKKGQIVNVASVAGLVGDGFGRASYSASKHALVGLTKSLALEYAKQGICVNAVCPGFIDTPMLDECSGHMPAVKESLLMFQPIGRFGKPEEVADLVAFLCSDKSTFMTGSAVCIDGAATAF